VDFRGPVSLSASSSVGSNIKGTLGGPLDPLAPNRDRQNCLLGTSIDNPWVSSGICAGHDFHRMGPGQDYVPCSPPSCRFDRATRQNRSCFDLGNGSSCSGRTNPVLLWHLAVSRYTSDGRSDLGYLSSLINLSPVTLPPPHADHHAFYPTEDQSLNIVNHEMEEFVWRFKTKVFKIYPCWPLSCKSAVTPIFGRVADGIAAP